MRRRKQGWTKQACVVVLIIGGILLYTWNPLTVNDTSKRQDRNPETNLRPGTDIPSTVNKTWLKLRQSLLSDPDRITKIILLSYMRGGSSFGGEMFNRDETALLWYEPFDHFYTSHLGLSPLSIPEHLTYFPNSTRRTKTKLEIDLITDYFRNMFLCMYQKFSPEVSHHSFMYVPREMPDLDECEEGGSPAPTPPSRLTKHTQLSWKEYLEQRTGAKISTSINRCVSLISFHCGSSAGPKIHMSRNRRNITAACENKCLEIIHTIRKIPDLSRPVSELIEVIRTTVEGIPESVDLEKFLDHGKCVRGMPKTPCMEDAKDMCNLKDIQAVEVLRLNMEDLEATIQEFPDVHVIHYVRDPRGIIASRKSLPVLMWEFMNAPVETEAQILCPKIQGDIEAKKALASKYPGVFIDLKFEDLVLNPHEAAEGVYKKIGRRVGKQWKLWSLNSTQVSKGHKSFGTEPRNASMIVSKWQRSLSAGAVMEIRKVCRDVIEELGYEFCSLTKGVVNCRNQS